MDGFIGLPCSMSLNIHVGTLMQQQTVKGCNESMSKKMHQRYKIMVKLEKLSIQSFLQNYSISGRMYKSQDTIPNNIPG